MMPIGPLPWTTGLFVTFASQWMNRISPDAFARLSRPATHLAGIRKLSFRAEQAEPKDGAARFIRICPQSAPVRFDDRPADRQPHPHAAALRGVEGFEYAFQMCRVDARARIAHGHEDTCMLLLGADRKLPRSRLSRAHCFDRVQDQIQDDLLQLDAIAMNRKHFVRKPGLDRDAIPDDLASRQRNHFRYRRIEIEIVLSGRCFPYLITDSTDDVSGSIGIAYEAAECFPDLT